MNTIFSPKVRATFVCGLDTALNWAGLGTGMSMN